MLYVNVKCLIIRQQKAQKWQKRKSVEQEQESKSYTLRKKYYDTEESEDRNRHFLKIKEQQAERCTYMQNQNDYLNAPHFSQCTIIILELLVR